jgi:hypothetical protein
MNAVPMYPSYPSASGNRPEGLSILVHNHLRSVLDHLIYSDTAWSYAKTRSSTPHAVKANDWPEEELPSTQAMLFMASAPAGWELRRGTALSLE